MSGRLGKGSSVWKHLNQYHSPANHYEGTSELFFYYTEHRALHYGDFSHLPIKTTRSNSDIIDHIHISLKEK